MKREEWICVDDYEGTGFHLGDTKTPEGWKEWALQMNEMSESEDYEKFKAFPPKVAMEYVADMWQIGLEPYDATNPEHIKLRKEWEQI